MKIKKTVWLLVDKKTNELVHTVEAFVPLYYNTRQAARDCKWDHEKVIKGYWCLEY